MFVHHVAEKNLFFCNIIISIPLNLLLCLTSSLFASIVCAIRSHSYINITYKRARVSFYCLHCFMLQNDFFVPEKTCYINFYFDTMYCSVKTQKERLSRSRRRLFWYRRRSGYAFSRARVISAILKKVETVSSQGQWVVLKANYSGHSFFYLQQIKQY